MSTIKTSKKVSGNSKTTVTTVKKVGKVEATKAPVVEVKTETPATAVEPTPPPFEYMAERREKGGSSGRGFDLATTKGVKCVEQGYIGPALMAVFEGESAKTVPVKIIGTSNKDYPQITQDGMKRPRSVHRSLLFKSAEDFAESLDASEILCKPLPPSFFAKGIDMHGTGMLWGHTGVRVVVWAAGVVGFTSPVLGTLDKNPYLVTHPDDLKSLNLGSEAAINRPIGTFEGKPCVQVHHGFVAEMSELFVTAGAVIGEELYDERVATCEFFRAIFENTVSIPAYKRLFGISNSATIDEEYAKAGVDADGKKIEKAAKADKAPEMRVTNPTKGTATTNRGPSPLWDGTRILEWMNRNGYEKAAAELSKGVHPSTVLHDSNIKEPTHRAAILSAFDPKNTTRASVTNRETTALVSSDGTVTPAAPETTSIKIRKAKAKN